MITSRTVTCASWLMLLCGIGCDSGAPVTATRGLSGSGARTPAEAVSEQPAEVARQPLRLTEEDFLESERHRDPFRSHVSAFRMRAPEVSQRRVIMADTAIEEMRLIAIVTSVPQPKAMFVDPAGMGHVVERGVFIGRSHIAQSGHDGVPVTLNWRVERIRANEVVLTREDPSDPLRPPLSRVIPLHEGVLSAQL